MRVYGGKPGPKPRHGTTNRLGHVAPPVPKHYIDPIEYAQKALAREYAARRAQYEREVT